MRVIDFFCGAGGFSEGFRQAGFKVIWGVDKWQIAIITHRKNHPDANTVMGDVEMIAYLPDEEFDQVVPDSEIIIGSPPCIAFSNSNKSGKGDKAKGIRLIEAYLRIVARKKFKTNSILKYWILENVPNAQPYVKEEYSADELGLNGEFKLKVKFESSKLYNTQYFGVPSKRKRFICGDFPEPQKTVDSDENLIHLAHVLNKLKAPKLESDTNIILDPNYDFAMQSCFVTDHHYIQEIAEFEWQKAKRLKQDKGYMGKMSFPEDVNRPARTVMATMSFSARESMIFGYEKNRYRAPTIREVASLMSFPIDYRFYGESIGVKYHLVGNAVPPKMSFALAKAIAQKENLEIPDNYVPLTHDNNDPEFKNLNLQKTSIRTEVAKNSLARFKYHIPYLIIDTFRVELTNHHSDFKAKEFKWDVEIHKSQGPKADWFTPMTKPNWIPQEITEKIKYFITEYSKKVPDPGVFQEIYCQTDIYRKSNGLIGPIEMLYATRSFIDSLNINSNKGVKIMAKKKKIELPLLIAIGYYVLSEVMNHTRRQ